MVTNRARGATETVAAAIIARPTALGADGTTITRLLLGGFVGVRSGRSLGYRGVVQIRVGGACRTHIAIEPAASRVGRGAGSRHIGQEVLIAFALHAVAGVVTDVMVVAGRGEVDVPIRTDLVGDDVTDEALSWATTIEFRHMSGVRHAIRAEGKIGNRMDRLDATDFATLRGWIIGYAIARRRSQRHSWRPNTGRGQDTAERCTQQPFQHCPSRRALAKRTRQVIETSFFQCAPKSPGNRRALFPK